MQYLFDENGRRYLDVFGGIATVSCGHCHPEVVEAVIKQTKKLQHSTIVYLNHAIADFAEALASKMPGDLKVALSSHDVFLYTMFRNFSLIESYLKQSLGCFLYKFWYWSKWTSSDDYSTLYWLPRYYLHPKFISWECCWNDGRNSPVYLEIQYCTGNYLHFSFETKIFFSWTIMSIVSSN